MVFGYGHCSSNHYHSQMFGVLPNLILEYIDMSDMEHEYGPALSARKVEYLKFIFRMSGMVRTSEIASAFNVDPSTITKTLAELNTSGYLTYIPYHGVCLTDSGKRHAEFLVKRHRIISLMMVRNGLTTQQACREASRFESQVSKNAIDRICRFIGHPLQGVCGEITHENGCLLGGESSSVPLLKHGL
jgi:DtxR family Mn-dependent transcriptional regulator